MGQKIIIESLRSFWVFWVSFSSFQIVKKSKIIIISPVQSFSRFYFLDEIDKPQLVPSIAKV